MKKTVMICQPFGIGDILFIQKIILYYAGLGFHVVVPILESLAWMRYYLIPHEGVEYPLIKTVKGQWVGDFKFADAFLPMYIDAFYNHDKPIYKTPIAYNDADAENGFVFLALSECYAHGNDKLMPSKYNFVNLDFSDWVDHVHLKRRPHVERELYYDVLGLSDDSQFTLVNEKSSRSSVSLPVPGAVVTLREIDGFTLFDWFLTIEKAAQIVTIDTSLVLLAEILKIKAPLYMISRYDPPSFEEIKDILKLDWTLVPTAADLKVSPVG